MRHILKSIATVAMTLCCMNATAQDNWPDKLYCRRRSGRQIGVGTYKELSSKPHGRRQI